MKIKTRLTVVTMAIMGTMGNDKCQGVGDKNLLKL